MIKKLIKNFIIKYDDFADTLYISVDKQEKATNSFLDDNVSGVEPNAFRYACTSPNLVTLSLPNSKAAPYRLLLYSLYFVPVNTVS